MKNFFFIDTIYVDGFWGIIKNRVFSGVQFKDHESQLVKSNREHFHRSDSTEDYYSYASGTSDVCGMKTNNSSGWISVPGPVKGSYVNKTNIQWNRN